MSKIPGLSSRETDHARFERLLSPHFNALYSAAFRLAGDSADAEDLVQEVCMKAFTKLSDLEAMEYRQAWLLRVLYNVFIDGVRRNARSPHSDALSEDSVVLKSDPRIEPENEADRLFDRDRLQRAMQVLNHEHCTLLALHDIDGYSVRELASLTGLTESNIKSRLHRTRARLGRLLKRDEYGLSQLELVRN